MGTVATSAVEVEHLRVTYGDLVAVDGASFTVAAGEVMALLGANGAGKTSTLEVLGGFLAPTSGQARVLGLEPRADHAALVTRVGVMLQQGGVYTAARPIEMLRLYAAFYADPIDPNELLDRVGLTDRATATWRNLSGGEQQRLSLALALIGRPELVFLDEPTAGVDPAGRQQIRSVIDDLRGDGTSVLLTTHDLDEVERIADHVVILDHGTVVADGSPRDLMRTTTQDEIRFGAPAQLDVTTLATDLNATITEPTPGEYVVTAAPTPINVARITSWLAERDIPLADLRASRQSLEDVFLRLTASDESSDSSGGNDTGPSPTGGSRRSRKDQPSRRGRR